MTNSESPVQRTAPAASVVAAPLFYVMYRSHSVIPAGSADSELAKILKGARAKNAKLDITGALMLYDDWFAQVLEGPEPAVKALYEQIKTDKRHNGVQLIDEGMAATRTFERWAMAHVGEHGDPDIPMVAIGDKLAKGAAWRPGEAQEVLIAQLRQATRGYGRGS